MIASVRGEVLDIALDHVVIEAAGVGYKVMSTRPPWRRCTVAMRPG